MVDFVNAEFMMMLEADKRRIQKYNDFVEMIKPDYRNMCSSILKPIATEICNHVNCRSHFSYCYDEETKKIKTEENK